MVRFELKFPPRILNIFFRGLTELAERFPEDFTSLMDTFHEPNPHPHSPASKSISPMDILNLANMITQVRS